LHRCIKTLAQCQAQ